MRVDEHPASDGEAKNPSHDLAVLTLDGLRQGVESSG